MRVHLTGPLQCQNILLLWLPEKRLSGEGKIIFFPSSSLQIMVGGRKTYLAFFHTSPSFCKLTAHHKSISAWRKSISRLPSFPSKKREKTSRAPVGRGRVTGSEKRGGGVKEAAQREFFIHCLGNNFVQMRFGKLPQKCSDNSRYTLKHFHLHKHAVWHLTLLFHDSLLGKVSGKSGSCKLESRRKGLQTWQGNLS